ncbi:hypothetical protein GOEFS_059_00320 [Gordonia effusa NBRC 100432]|uniref:Translation initiation factor n=1 Tax=Gordonia effusa NBRC 100432 TaxID=1077974 RepID=H0R0J7_9ACTN|nr:DUF6319 family protein [Gordonia effusa]GAB18598.1 hypothetical protein GOEFS_059_00320 [Gordonia effusa NBRC 100432]
MPPRRSGSESLTPDDLAALTAAVAEGKQPLVYLREGTPSLGLTPGASARVLAVSGETVTVKPRGVDDALPYEADELRMTKNVAPQAAKPAKAKTSLTPRVRPPSTPATRAPATTPTKPATPTATSPKPAAPAKPASPSKSARRTGGKKPPAAVTVTIFGSPDNAWSVSVTRGGRKPTRSRTITPDSVEAALHELDDAAALDAASSVLNAARDEAQRRVDELSRELAAAQEELAALAPK